MPVANARRRPGSRAPSGALTVYLALAFISALPWAIGGYRVVAGLTPAPWADAEHRIAAIASAGYLAAFVFVVATLTRNARRALFVGAAVTTASCAGFWVLVAEDVRSDVERSDWISLPLGLAITVVLLWAVWRLWWQTVSPTTR